jgi:uroporphyrin-III C-methyltransferase
MKNPKLTLVGAGPGDIELITLKGLKALAQADVVLYDALVNPELLNHAPVGSLKLYVGKRKGNHEFTQEQINNLIVDYAFVFGRGHEEIQYADSFNIETEYIPGISSSIGVPGLQGIPVTSRGYGESFWVITGTTASGELSEDVRAAAQTNATVVILMGVSKLRKIVDVFQSFNKQDMPIAIIQNGSLPDEKIALGTIDTIIRIAEEEKIGSPAVIVIGEVVKLHAHFPSHLREWKSLLEIKN